MGMFLAISAVIGKSKNEVEASIRNYCLIEQSNLESASIDVGDPNCAVILAEGFNTSVLYPYYYNQWDKEAQYLSKDLQSPVFSIHIHDSDLWMFVLFLNGEIATQFNPQPDYWGDISNEERASWKGDAALISKLLTIDAAIFEKYFKQWNIDEDKPQKAYPTDDFTYNDEWQLLDFMKKLKLPYPMDDDGNPRGDIYKFWTVSHPMQNKHANMFREANTKPWWKFW